MSWATAAGILGPVLGGLGLVVFIWRLVSWGRADNKNATRWEVECRAAWAARDTLTAALQESRDALVQQRAAYAQLHVSFVKLASHAVSAATDDDAVRLAGGDLPPPGIGNGLLEPTFDAPAGS